MASPLSPKANAALNATTPSITLRQQPYNYSQYCESMDDNSTDPASSPFVPHISDHGDRENISPIKLSEITSPIEREAMSIERESMSPLKMLKSRAAIQSPIKSIITERSPRKISSPEKRFPVKVATSLEKAPVTHEQTLTLGHALRDNEGLTKAIEILEDEESMLDYENMNGGSDDTIVVDEDAEHEGFADETAFSTFSAVPDMTMFAKIGHSPTKFASMGQTPRRINPATPAAMRMAVIHDLNDSPTPRRRQEHSGGDENNGNTTNLILDFTEQFNTFSGQSTASTRHGRSSPAKSQTVPELFAYTHNARTPSPAKYRQPQSPTSRMSNLLDFDIPPPPTPRSMPSITPRELESLKSTFLSEISSLKASLSGKEAEVSSLKTAVGDAENRVGECMEQVREERNLKEQLSAEKEGWEKRGREMELVLRNVKEEIVHGEREREELEGRLDESEKRREAAEMMAQEAESKMAAMRAGSASTSDMDADDKKSQAGSNGQEVEIAVEKVARELHTLYKSKHETKVAALKKSYESRWGKKFKDLEGRLDDVTRENEELRLGRDATMSGVVPRLHSSDFTEELREQAATDAKARKELEARLEGVSEEVKSVKRDNDNLRHDLEKERVEKGELVAACDELLALQESAPPAHSGITPGVENLRGSISRASGLRAPNYSSTPSAAGESRIGRMERRTSGNAQNLRPGSGLAMRSGIMSSIEKMGSYKGRAE